MLTGKTRYRIGWRNKLVVQVEYDYGTRANFGNKVFGPHYNWRDATIEDMQAIDRGEIRSKEIPLRPPNPPPPPKPIVKTETRIITDYK